jgi:ParB family chromosome partitioning protein
MSDRRYEFLPIDKIVVLNSRDREQERFSENVQSIQTVGLLKPVLVNARFLPESGKYELVCGEGRLTAHQRIGKTEIAAEIIDCDRKDAYLISLIENIARVPVGTMWFARELKRMREAGMTISEIARIVGKCESQVTGHVRLVEQGEERLLRGVEQGVFPITIALKIAESDAAQTQNLLMDAFDTGIVTSANIRTVRKIIKERENRASVERGRTSSAPSLHRDQYSVDQLKEDIVKTCREKKAFVREAQNKEGRLVYLVEGLKMLRTNPEFLELLESEALAEVPALQGLYKV